MFDHLMSYITTLTESAFPLRHNNHAIKYTTCASPLNITEHGGDMKYWCKRHRALPTCQSLFDSIVQAAHCQELLSRMHRPAVFFVDQTKKKETAHRGQHSPAFSPAAHRSVCDLTLTLTGGITQNSLCSELDSAADYTTHLWNNLPLH